MTLSRKRTYLARTVTSSHLIFFVRAVVWERVWLLVDGDSILFSASTTKRRVWLFDAEMMCRYLLLMYFALFWSTTVCFCQGEPKHEDHKDSHSTLPSLWPCWLNLKMLIELNWPHIECMARIDCIANLYEVPGFIVSHSETLTCFDHIYRT